ncbi:6-phosphofructokinase [Mycoplasma todarodis]|uniref:6-phosphofructokinase n=1 Tax=Mycoplasma todarodis TaxID=1937191 RepID=UPI003B2B7F11
MKKILLIASGGDAPGINDFIYHLWQAFPAKDIELYYSPYGARNLWKNELEKLDIKNPNYLLDAPSSIIGCGRFPEFVGNEEIMEQTIKNAKEFDHVVLLGGNGSYMLAQKLAENGVKISFVPLTVDNDVDYTSQTLGFRTALNTVVESINRIYYSVNAHGYVSLVEIMGRQCPDLTELSFKLSHADIAVTNNQLMTPQELAQEVKKIHDEKGTATVLIMEKMKYSIHEYAEEISKLGMQARPNVLGHVQRGGRTTVGDKMLAYEFANETQKSINENKSFAIGKNIKINMEK